MSKVSYVVALCLGAMVITNGCVAENTKVVEDEIVIGPGGGGGQCGSKVCTGKTFCCNASCGICAPIGGGCTQQVCLTADDSTADDSTSEPADELVSTPDAEDNIRIGSQPCGKNTCTGNTHCCNASCGTCVGPGGHCTQQICQPTD